MKRLISPVIIFMLLISILAGCGSKVSAVKIDLDKSNYTVFEDKTPNITPITPESDIFESYRKAVDMAIEAVPARCYTFDFSSAGFLTEDELRNYLIPVLREQYGEDQIVEKSYLGAVGAWTKPTENGFETDIKEIWISSYENVDGDIEFVIDILRNNFTLRSLSYIEDGSELVEKVNTVAPNYDGKEPADLNPLIPEVTDKAETLYFGGRLHKTGIFEVPVLDHIDFLFKIKGKPVEGSGLPGGFAGGFEGVVTIDGQSFPLTLDSGGLVIPVGLVSDPSMYYIAFSNVGISNPQDKNIYRNVFFIKKDLSGIVGLYSLNKHVTYCDFFEVTRISSDTFTNRANANNEKLTALYSDVIKTTYGNRKEYNNTLAVLYNMFIGVEQNYLVKNLTSGISTVSKDIRDYADAIKDDTVSRLGENGYYFFPDGRSMVVRLYTYDGAYAVAAIDFSSKQDDGYGALYEATYANGKWTLNTLLNSRIR